MSKWENTKWISKTGTTTTIQDVLEKLKNEPTISLNISSLKHIPSCTLERQRVDSADLTTPVIVVEKDGVLDFILDGHHRRQRAIEENRDYIIAKILRDWID